MKVIYYSYPFFADCDFPLIKALQDKGIDVHYYMPLPRNFQRASILEFEKPLRGTGFVKASKMKEMQVYKNCIDLDRLYFLKGFPRSPYWIPSWCLWIYALFHMKRKKADIVHIDWQFNNYPFEKLLFSFSLGKKKVMTVHDPIMHSGQPNFLLEEKRRVISFRWADHFILLNRLQASAFMEKYSVPERKISYSRLPNYDSISKILPSKIDLNFEYILFFGQIIPYKGLEYLLDAMIKVHEILPSLKLIVAGRGDIYFDMSKYRDLDYIIWFNHYIGIRELAGLLEKTKFVVCPYKEATQSGVVHTAFAMGTPVIASNVGTLSSDVVDGQNGIIVPPCSVPHLADAIVGLYRDNNRLLYMKDFIVKCNAKNLSRDKVSEEYCEIYNHVK